MRQYTQARCYGVGLILPVNICAMTRSFEAFIELFNAERLTEHLFCLRSK